MTFVDMLPGIAASSPSLAGSTDWTQVLARPISLIIGMLTFREKTTLTKMLHKWGILNYTELFVHVNAKSAISNMDSN